MPSITKGFDYSSIGHFDVGWDNIEFDFPVSNAVLNGTLLPLGVAFEDFGSPYPDFQISVVEWSGNATTIFTVWEPQTLTNSIFVLNGDPLPEFDTVADLNAWLDTTTFNRPGAVDQINTGTQTPFAEIPSVRITENDVITGSYWNNTINGGRGHDSISGGYGDDRLIGGAGRDVLRGDEGADVLLGGGSNDTLIGGQGNDRLVGDKGKDLLWGAEGNDILKGGSGADTFVFNSYAGKDRIVDFDAVRDTLLLERNLVGSGKVSDFATIDGNKVTLNFGSDILKITVKRGLIDTVDDLDALTDYWG
ncbi:MAG: hypothetical protein KUG74_01380 [Rhodobacteraceae bacterium]|nr:hypothetical protein [Paracoccaceae bacterium]